MANSFFDRGMPLGATGNCSRPTHALKTREEQTFVGRSESALYGPSQR
jgi:hypothetical protein